MLNPNENRLDYGQVLAAPEGYTLDFAVGTTYSLDLDALIGACIALGLSEETDSDMMKNPICLLEALRSTGDKVALFCEGGQIHLPNNVTPLYILLEKMVFQVNTSKIKGIAKYPSFHPKFWLLRYINEHKTALYRLVVLSRNLTFDRSWDVTFCIEGKVTDAETDKTAPVADFLSYLLENMANDENSKIKSRQIKRIQKELSHVHFQLDSREFEDFEFLPVGIKSSNGGFHTTKDKGYNQLFVESNHEVFIMSPFLTNSVIKGFVERNRYLSHPRYCLITRAMSLPKLNKEDCSDFKIYTIKDVIVDGETAISEDSEHAQKQDIHAKIYMVRKYSDSYLYLGSLNASHNAISGNVEFMVKLKSKSKHLDLDKLTSALFCGDADSPTNPFQEVSLEKTQLLDQEDELVNALDSYVKEVNRMKGSAIVMPNEEHYDLSVNFAKYKESEYTVAVSPLLSKKSQHLAEIVFFNDLSITQLSEFYKISVSDGTRTVSRVIKIPTKNLPEDREKAVVSGIVDNKECFYRYIAFLLGDNFVMSAMEYSVEETSGEGNSRRIIQLPALYEKMLLTASTAPERFKEIDYLVKAISADGVIPEGFEELYNTFKKVVKLDG